jgi:hypothetical protein
MTFLTSTWIIGFVFAWCYFVGGKFEVKQRGGRNPGPFWALASLLVTVGVIQGLGGGVILVIFGQVVLFIAITAWRVKFDK